MLMTGMQTPPLPSAFTTDVLYPSLVGGFLIIMAAIGWFFRTIYSHFQKAQMSIDEKLDKIIKKQTDQETAITTINTTYPTVMKRLDEAEDFVEELRMTVAVIVSQLKDHLGWHERQGKRQQTARRDDSAGG